MIELDIPLELVDEFVNLSNNGPATSLKDLSYVEKQDSIQKIISKVIDLEHFHYGNVFNHTTPFTIHSDVSYKKKSILLIPVQAHSSQKFVVFDQTINAEKEVSWIYDIFNDKTDAELKEMYYESSIKSRPYDTPGVENLTDIPVDDDVYCHLPYTKDLYFGLTGVVWDYTPGKALLFPANRIHATGIMQSSKIGCTVQFRESIDNLEILTSTRNLF